MKYKHHKYYKKKKSSFKIFGIAFFAIIIFFSLMGKNEDNIIKNQNIPTSEVSPKKEEKTLLTAYMKGKNDDIINGEAYDFETDLGKRFFDKEVKDNGLPNSETIFNIGQKLFGNFNFKVSAFYGEYYVVDREARRSCIS